MTDAERLMWSIVRRKKLKGYQFYRQRVVKGYIVDFYCPAAKLIIELDGGQHYGKRGMEKDIKRDNCLKELGYKILRFSDYEIFENTREVIERIYNSL
jgi:very-short-patch-repair endonuclease